MTETFVIQNAHSYRIVDPRPVGIRWLVRADGSKVLQFAHTWQEGSMHGVEWSDVPEVQE